ncbi:MAG: DUF4389 domain-containing protein [Gammaproteobacteria bacterium]
MSDDVKDNIRQTKTWMRALYMLLFAIIYAVTEVIITAVVVFQFLLVLFTGKTNSKLLIFGQSLSTFIYQILQYLTFNTESQPYPFGEWPKGAPTATKSAPKKKKTRAVTKPAETDETPE